MISTLKSYVLDPYPLRRLALGLAKRVDWGNFDFKYFNNTFGRPNYAYIMYESALLARRLGMKRISVLEFGVAGGNGLVAMERLAEQIEQKLGDIEIEIYGFDTGQGLPKPEDYRDLPYQWKEGFFPMDEDALRSRLTRAKLVLGDIRDTAGDFFKKYQPAPVAAVSHDFDYYSSTAAALQMFDAPGTNFLPRVFCYFDDTVGGNLELYNEYTGQRGAINDFNQNHTDKKLCPPVYLKSRAIQEPWYQQIYVHHHFSHPDYCQFIAEKNQQLNLGH